MMQWSGLEALIARIEYIERELQARGTLKRLLGKLLVQQTQRRIQVEKTSPDGRPWAPWSARYAATRKAHHSLLIDTGAMLQSIKATVRSADQVAVTSDREYAGRQNAVRPFMGVSDSNRDEIDNFTNAWLGRVMAQ
jgi:hypothetical protein